MFKASAPLKVEQVLSYYRQEYSRGDYYSSGPEEARGNWVGSGAQELQLTGEVAADDFEALAHGRDPSGTQLVAGQIASGAHRAGFDFTVAPDKSVSVAALVAGDQKVVDAHLAAADKAFGLLEENIQARTLRAGMAVRETTGRAVAARFDHLTSRNLDPQLHSHYVIFNLTRREDGQWRALEPRELYASQKLATAAYHAELATRLQALGYNVAVDDRGHAKISGVPPALLERFSTRRQEILAELARSGSFDGQHAAHKTRRAKVRDVSIADLTRHWQRAAAELGFTRDDMRGARESEQVTPRSAIEWATGHLSERSSRFTERDLLTESLRHSAGRGGSVDALRNELPGAPVLRAPDGRLTTPELVRLETANANLAARPETMPPITTHAALPKSLDPGQRSVAEHILTERSPVLAVIGKAGAGKTFTLGAVQSAAVAAGWELRAYAVTTGAVAELKHAGLAGAATVASLEASAPPSENPRRLWLVDEASLLSTRQANAVLTRARDAGARLVLIGDPRQHHAVEAGDPFSALLAQGVPASTLSKIRRQLPNPDLLKAVELAAAGQSRAAAQELIAQGKVETIPAADGLRRRAVEAYLEAPRDSLLIAPSRAERAALNEGVHNALRAAGKLQGDELSRRVLVPKDLTNAEAKDSRSYEAGDHLHFRRGSKLLGIPRQAEGIVESVASDHVTVRLSYGKLVSFQPSRLSGLTVAEIKSIPLAVGDSVRFRRPYKTLGVANGTRADVLRIGADGSLHLKLATRDAPEISLEQAQLVALDHAYASTSHGAQGATVKRAVVVIDTQHTSALVNREQFYVSVSRASHEAIILTNSSARLPDVVDRVRPHTNALEPSGTPHHEPPSRQTEPGRGGAAAAPSGLRSRAPRDRSRGDQVLPPPDLRRDPRVDNSPRAAAPDIEGPPEARRGPARSLPGGDPRVDQPPHHRRMPLSTPGRPDSARGAAPHSPLTAKTATDWLAWNAAAERLEGAALAAKERQAPTAPALARRAAVARANNVAEKTFLDQVRRSGGLEAATKLLPPKLAIAVKLLSRARRIVVDLGLSQ